MTQVLIEGYDHLCPWSGTVIGKKNMVWFRRHTLGAFDSYS